ncbi:MAG: sulfite exporter TauE/SafE family protein [Bacteroidetes bacterium]|nr:sulfite exporter TauE/SafE family protein [Bacteroidota bacterium]
MNAYQVAFYIGLFGSIHCIGMCGPLAFAVPSMPGNRARLLFDKFVYQLGRIISYTVLGLIAGIIGRQLWLAGLQQGVSIASGALVLTAACSRIFKISFKNSNAGGKLYRIVNKAVIYGVNNRWGHIFIGMLNGFLPCGFVYLALAGAVNTTSAGQAMYYMFWFGMGTLPLMFLAAVSSGFVSLNMRRRLNRIVPYFMLLLGCWFILRGSNLDIPYLSPQKNAAFISNCH